MVVIIIRNSDMRVSKFLEVWGLGFIGAFSVWRGFCFILLALEMPRYLVLAKVVLEFESQTCVSHIIYVNVQSIK